MNTAENDAIRPIKTFVITARRVLDLTESAAKEDWPAVAAALVDSREPGDVWLRTFARNMHELRTHRPSVYREVLACGEIGAVAARCRDERIVDAFADCDTYRRTGQAIAVLGAGDGSLWRSLARFPLVLLANRQQEVNLLEPELSRLAAMLGQVDLTGPRGPIQQRRFAWHVGCGWAESLANEFLSTSAKMFPQQLLHAAEPRTEIEDGLNTIASRIKLAASAHNVAADAYYDSLDDAELLAVFGSNPPRRPRVLLVTSLFTTVLQYSTQDSADAFRKLGWDVRVEIEQEPWHAMSKPAIHAAIAEFKPDLFFQIDHLRYELSDILPAKLPHVCWIQDHLVNMTSRQAGQSVGERDFVLTGATYRYVDRYSYPRRQCIDMPKVARAPEVPASWAYDREDILYVSHWSATPEAIIVEVCNRVRELNGASTEATMRVCCAEVTAVYASGRSIRTEFETRQIVRAVFARRGETLNAETEQFFVHVLFLRLNNAYYRQQALHWAGQIAGELGLKFGIYGTGWETHPTLGQWARGPVTYGPDLEALTRQSKILLQLEPYACYTHQRVLDALLAGGFVLAREHPLNTMPILVRKFLDAHVPTDVNSVADARTYLTHEQNAEFDRIIAEAWAIDAMGDVVDVVRGWRRANLITDSDETLPHLSEITFDSFETLRDRVKRFVADDVARKQVADDQCASIAGRLTYVSALSDAMAKIHGLLSETLVAASSGDQPDVRPFLNSEAA